MTSENETVADIAKMMRRNEEVFHYLYWCEYADRIEAAHQREVAKLRIGIKELLDALQSIYNEECTSYGTSEIHDKWRKALETTKGAEDEEGK